MPTGHPYLDPGGVVHCASCAAAVSPYVTIAGELRKRTTCPLCERSLYIGSTTQRRLDAAERIAASALLAFGVLSVVRAAYLAIDGSVEPPMYVYVGFVDFAFGLYGLSGSGWLATPLRVRALVGGVLLVTLALAEGALLDAALLLLWSLGLIAILFANPRPVALVVLSILLVPALGLQGSRAYGDVTEAPVLPGVPALLASRGERVFSKQVRGHSAAYTFDVPEGRWRSLSLPSIARRYGSADLALVSMDHDAQIVVSVSYLGANVEQALEEEIEKITRERADALDAQITAPPVRLKAKHRDVWVYEQILPQAASPDRLRERNAMIAVDRFLFSARCFGGERSFAPAPCDKAFSSFFFEGEGIDRLYERLEEIAAQGDDARFAQFVEEFKLVERFELKERTPKNRRTLVMLACGYGLDKSCRSLLARGLDPDAKDERWDTALLYAARERHPGAIADLVRGGASLDERDYRGYTALMYSVMHDDAPNARLLLERGASPNLAANDGDSPLFHAVAARNLPMIDMLLAHGADPHQKVERGLSPLMIAHATGDPRIERALRRAR